MCPRLRHGQQVGRRVALILFLLPEYSKGLFVDFTGSRAPRGNPYLDRCVNPGIHSHVGAWENFVSHT